MRFVSGLLCVFFFGSALAGENGIGLAAEKNYRRTLVADARIPAGSTVHVRLVKLKANEQLGLYKCGPGCNTASQVASWNTGNSPLGAEKTHRLAEGGEFYFWVQQKQRDGKVEPVQIAKVAKAKGHYAVQFESGSKVDVHIDPGQKSPRQRTPK